LLVMLLTVGEEEDSDHTYLVHYALIPVLSQCSLLVLTASAYKLPVLQLTYIDSFVVMQLSVDISHVFSHSFSL